jgi:hypothetical protein
LYLNGARLIEGQDFTATDGSVVGLTTYAQNGDVLELVAYKAFNATNVQSAGGDFSVGGNLSVTGNTELTGTLTVGGVEVQPGAAGTWASYDSNTGISTTKKVKIENNLEVTGAASTFSGNLTVAGQLTYEDVTNVDSIGIITARSDVSIADKIIHTGDTNTAIRFPAADTFTVETGGSERLRISSAGLVGINTTTPTEKLSVNGNVVFGHDQPAGNPGSTIGVATVRGHHVNSDADYAELYFANSTSSGGSTASIRAGRSGDNAGTNLTFYTQQFGGSAGNGTERLRIDQNGNVKIGSGAPAQSLHVTDSTAYEGILINGNGAPRVTFARSSNTTVEWGVGIDGTDGSKFAIAQAGNTAKLIMDVGGNVNITGVGTAIQWDATSDITLKENIEIINEPIVKLSQLKGVTFDWKFGGHSVGVIAQDVEKVLPTAVGGSKDQKTVNYNAIIGLLVESVKDQQKQIEELKSLLDK